MPGLGRVSMTDNYRPNLNMAAAHNRYASPPCSVSLRIPFPSKAGASVACRTLSVDSEPKRGGSKKSLDVSDNYLNVCITSNDTKQLRTALNSFMDHLILVSRTIDAFGPAV